MVKQLQMEIKSLQYENNIHEQQKVIKDEEQIALHHEFEQRRIKLTHDFNEALESEKHKLQEQFSLAEAQLCKQRIESDTIVKQLQNTIQSLQVEKGVFQEQQTVIQERLNESLAKYNQVVKDSEQVETNLRKQIEESQFHKQDLDLQLKTLIEKLHENRKHTHNIVHQGLKEDIHIREDLTQTRIQLKAALKANEQFKFNEQEAEQLRNENKILQQQVLEAVSRSKEQEKQSKLQTSFVLQSLHKNNSINSRINLLQSKVNIPIIPIIAQNNIKLALELAPKRHSLTRIDDHIHPMINTTRDTIQTQNPKESTQKQENRVLRKRQRDEAEPLTAWQNQERPNKLRRVDSLPANLETMENSQGPTLRRAKSTDPISRPRPCGRSQSGLQSKPAGKTYIEV
jgi:hypothetical protein